MRLIACAVLSCGAAPPAVGQTTAPPPGAAAPGPAQAAPVPPPAPPPPAWVPRTGADLLVLDKVSADATPLSIAVGGQATFGTLTIAVRACAVRPPDQAPDATAFLDVTDSTQGSPEFHGWLIRSAPAVSTFENPEYDIRLTGCR